MIELNSSGLAQTWPLAAPVGINDGQGTNGGLYVGNGQGSTLGGPITAGSLTLSVNTIGPGSVTAYTALYTDWLIYCDTGAGGGVITITLPSTPGSGVAVGMQLVIAKKDSGGHNVVVDGTFLNDGTSQTLSIQGQMIAVVFVAAPSGYAWLITSEFTP